jgi:hypothetical protein
MPEHEKMALLELVRDVRTHADPTGAGAQAELTVRLIEALNRSGRRLELLTWALIGLTVVLVVIEVFRLFD